MSSPYVASHMYAYLIGDMTHFHIYTRLIHISAWLIHIYTRRIHIYIALLHIYTWLHMHPLSTWVYDCTCTHTYSLLIAMYVNVNESCINVNESCRNVNESCVNVKLLIEYMSTWLHMYSLHMTAHVLTCTHFHL